jgi:DNA-binding response OmpR family regulator
MRKKILAVDDEPANLEIIKEALSEHYDLRTASTGEEALEIAPEFIPDLIVLDIMMPGIDGYEVCQRLREDLDFKSTPIIMVTAKMESEAMTEGMKTGADDYIIKPFEVEDLMESIEFFFPSSEHVSGKT